VAALVLVLFLVWWFTRDVTYVGNVKVSGLDGVPASQQEPLRLLAEDMAALVNELAARGYAWQSGMLPALRADDALSAAEQEQAVGLGTLGVSGQKSLLAGTDAEAIAAFLAVRGWSLTEEDPPSLEGASKKEGPLRARIRLGTGREGSHTLRMVITAE
jgi:hypothetical protein